MKAGLNLLAVIEISCPALTGTTKNLNVSFIAVEDYAYPHVLPFFIQPFCSSNGATMLVCKLLMYLMSVEIEDFST